MSDLLNFAKNIPDWMNKSFFERVIRHSEEDPQGEVVDFIVGAGSKPGDNFASSIFSAKINFKSVKTNGDVKSISVIIKTQMISAIENYDFLNTLPFFETEMDMYGRVLPEIQSLWLSIGDDDILCPK